MSIQGEHPGKESERRQATVVFADISGFTALSERLDPEALAGLMNRCFGTLEAAVRTHGGVVDKYIGDCIMALFGVPKTIESAPRQALNAAIEMRNRIDEFNRTQKLPRALGIHIGINTGLVLAGDIGGEVRRDFTVMGDTVNLAARFKDAAPMGRIFVGPETYRATREQFDFRELKPLTVKGKERPVAAYELRSTQPVIHRERVATADRRSAAAFVGREAEIAQLGEALARLLRGDGYIINVIGEAGMGKSRLIAEWTARAEMARALVLEARSLSIGQSLSFHPFTDLFRHWLELNEDEGGEAALARLDAAVRRLVADEAAEIVPFIATLMGLRLTGAHAERVSGIEGEALEKLVFRSVRKLLRRLAAERPLVLFFEDLHWADQSSIQLLDSLLRLVADSAVLFVLVFRPDFPETSGRVLEAARERHALQQVEIRLPPLDERQCGQLIESLLPTGDFPITFKSLIARRAEGNPFYIQEVIRSLIDAGVVETRGGRARVTRDVESVVIPGSIQEVIMARVDRLEEPSRRVLQVASVIGQSFYQRIIAAVCADAADLEARLTVLEERGLLLRRRTRRTASARRRTLAEEVECVFQHALIQQTVYESILQSTRRELHLKVARVIEGLFAEQLVDFYGTLAYHYSRAEELEKAEEYLFKAGDEAARSAASREALHYFREASRLYMRLHGDGGDAGKKARLEKNIALALLNKGDLPECVAHFDHALEHLGERVPRRPLVIRLRIARDLAAVLYHLYVRGGRRRTAPASETDREVFQIIFDRARALTTTDSQRLFLDSIGGVRRLSRVDATGVDQACALYSGAALLFSFSGLSFSVCERLLGIAQTLVDHDSVRDEFTYRSYRFNHYYLKGEWSDAFTVPAELVEGALRYGQFWDVNTFLTLRTEQHIDQGRFADARRDIAQVEEIGDAYGYDFAQPTHDGLMGLLCLQERRLEDALHWWDRYAARAEPLLNLFCAGHKARVQFLLSDQEGAAATLAQARDILARLPRVTPFHQCPYLLTQLLVDLAALERAAGDRSQVSALKGRAQQFARDAVRVAAKIARDRTAAYRLAGTLHWLLGARKRAVEWWSKSLQEGERLAAMPELGRTHLEIANRLSESGDSENQVAGLDAGEHGARAREILTGLGLDWDLARRELRAARAA